MKRAIKFRGRRIDNGEWIYGDLVHTDNNPLIMDQESEIFSDCETVDPDSVGQFTGLTDCNGVEVFEGDKCLMYWDDSEPEEGEVVYSGCSFCLRLEVDDYDVNMIKNSIEVIGNIYEHTNLIKP